MQACWLPLHETGEDAAAFGPHVGEVFRLSSLPHVERVCAAGHVAFVASDHSGRQATVHRFVSCDVSAPAADLRTVAGVGMGSDPAALHVADIDEALRSEYPQQ